MMFIFALLCCSRVIYSSYQGYIPDSWVDPTDMRHYDRHSKSMKSANMTASSNKLNNQTEQNATANQVKQCEVYLQRFVNLFLYSSRLKDESVQFEPNETINRKIDIIITAGELNRLRTLGKCMTSQKLNELDEILSRILKRERVSSLDTLLLSMTLFEILFSNLSWEKISFVMATLSFIVCLWMFAVGKSLMRIIAFIFLLFYMAGLAVTWRRMYLEAIADQFAYLKTSSNIPSKCNHSTSFWSWTRLFGSEEEECKRYYEQIHIDPFSKVSPSSVISETTLTIFIHPLKALGHGIGDLIIGISRAAPWPLNYLFLPFTFITLLIFLLCILLVGLCGIRFSFWTWLGGLNVGGTENDKIDYTKVTNEEHLLNILKYDDPEYVLVRSHVIRKYVPLLNHGEGDNHGSRQRFGRSSFKNVRSSSISEDLNNTVVPSKKSSASTHNPLVYECLNHTIISGEELSSFSQLCRVVSKSNMHFGKRKLGTLMKSKYK